MPTVALIGDSHSQALWPNVRKALAGTDYEVVFSEANAGWAEHTYRSRMPDLPARLASAKPDVVVVELGANVPYTRGTERYAEEMRWLLQVARDAGASRIIWYGPPATSSSADPSITRNHEWATEQQAALLPSLGVEWYDPRDITRTGHRSDGVHFDSASYVRWAGDITNTILNPPGFSLARIPKAVVISGTVGIAAILVVVALRLRGKI